MKKSVFDSFIFLLPGKVIKSKHLQRKDVRAIKNNLAHSFSLVSILGGLIMSALIGVMVIYQVTTINSNYVETFGFTALVGTITLIGGSLLSTLMIIIARLTKNNKVKIALTRIACDFLYACVCSYMICCIYADAEKGYTTQTEAISASIIFVAVLLLVQPMYWADALILDLGTAAGIVGVSVYCVGKFDMKGVYYYGLIALAFPFVCYMIIALLFYAETQRYKEVIENERLHNHAYYDSLTQCKNRHALNEFLEENKIRWSGRDNTNLLIILFDIDDFRLYNNQFSHLGGDFCLKSICDSIRKVFPSPDLDFYRYGGEEFLLFFELKDPKDAKIVAEKVRKSVYGLDITAPKGAPKENVTISVGALFIESVDRFVFEKEMEKVDEYLYKAKAAGKDVVCFNGSIIN